MVAIDAARGLLERRPRDFYCEACLAAELTVPRLIAKDVMARLAAVVDYRHIIERCDTCGRVTLAIGFVPPVKCGRCSWPIGEHDAFVAEQDQLFHHHCWRILESNARVADSRQITQSSRELVRRSVVRLRFPRKP